MSAALFLGAEKALSKTEYSSKEVFGDACCPNSIFFAGGVTFDDYTIDDCQQHIGRYYSKYNWYEVKANAMPFCFESKNKDAVPDLYEASFKLSEWLIRFLSEQLRGGNRLYLLQRWLGNSPDKKIVRTTLKLSRLKPTDFDLPYDALLKLRF